MCLLCAATDYIFTCLRTADSSTTYSRRLKLRYGGGTTRITVLRTTCRGSTFLFTLPMQRASTKVSRLSTPSQLPRKSRMTTSKNFGTSNLSASGRAAMTPAGLSSGLEVDRTGFSTSSWLMVDCASGLHRRAKMATLLAFKNVPSFGTSISSTKS